MFVTIILPALAIGLGGVLGAWLTAREARWSVWLGVALIVASSLALGVLIWPKR